MVLLVRLWLHSWRYSAQCVALLLSRILNEAKAIEEQQQKRSGWRKGCSTIPYSQTKKDVTHVNNGAGFKILNIA